MNVNLNQATEDNGLLIVGEMEESRQIVEAGIRKRAAATPGVDPPMLGKPVLVPEPEADGVYQVWFPVSFAEEFGQFVHVTPDGMMLFLDHILP